MRFRKGNQLDPEVATERASAEGNQNRAEITANIKGLGFIIKKVLFRTEHRQQEFPVKQKRENQQQRTQQEKIKVL